jgi:hypothetical protein
MRTYSITITGQTPILFHNDDIDWADRMDAWKTDKDNKTKSKAGDDRTPAFRWIGSLYHDQKQLVIPTDNIMRGVMEGGAMVLIPGAKNNKTFKAPSQSGIMPRDIGWPLLVGGRTVPFKPIAELMAEKDFEVHKQRVLDLGGRLFVKRVVIGTSKHIRVRPCFDQWSTEGQLIVTDDRITTAALADIFEQMGRFKGLCDWRPSSKTPGSYGMFTAEVRQVA